MPAQRGEMLARAQRSCLESNTVITRVLGGRHSSTRYWSTDTDMLVARRAARSLESTERPRRRCSSGTSSGPWDRRSSEVSELRCGMG
jgi:hypothetical protein